MPPLSQYEKYPALNQQPSVSLSREDPSIYSSEMRHPISAQQYGPSRIQGGRKSGGDINTGPTPLSNLPQHVSRSSMGGPPVHQELPAVSRPQAPSVAPVRQQETVRKTSSIMSLLNDEPSEPRPPPKREAPPAVPQPPSSPAPSQGLYQQTRQLPGTQPPPIRRETSLGDMHASQNYPRSSTSSQGPMRVESQYSAVVQSQSQQSRSHAGSPMEPTSATDFEYYGHQQSYGMHSQQQTPVDSPRLGPSFHNQSQQQPHRTMAFGTPTQRTASPPSQYTPNHPARHDSFDGRYPISSHPRYNSSGSAAPASYQPTPQPQHPLSSVRFAGHQSPTPQVQPTSQIPQQPPQPLQPQSQQHQQQSYAPLPTHPGMQHHIQSGPARPFSPPRPPTYDTRGYPEQQQQTPMRRQLLQTQQQQQQQQPQHLLPHQPRDQRE
jgi:hypothetical protein